YSDEEGFTPPDIMHVLEKVNNVAKATEMWNARGVKQPFDRIMYHTFNSIMPWKDKTCKQLFDEKTVMGLFFKRSFSTDYGKNPLPDSPESREFYKAHPEFLEHNKIYSGGLACKV
ncbi:unnamed protein product, partial [Polarella glacialis]